MIRKNLVVLIAIALCPEALVLGIGGIATPALASDAPSSIVVVRDPPPSGSTPSIPQYQVVTPTPGTGTVVVETPPTSGTGSSIPQYQVVVPGPNPAQNTGVGLGEQLSTPGKTVTVEPVPGP